MRMDDDTCRRPLPPTRTGLPLTSFVPRRVALAAATDILPVPPRVFLRPATMSGFELDRTYSVRTSNHKEPSGNALDYPSQTEKLLLDFVLQYRVGSDFIYRYVYSVFAVI